MTNDHLTNNHLTSEQMGALLANPELSELASQDGSQHLRDCAVCSAEFEELLAVISDLRVSATTVAERQLRVAARPVRSHRTPRVVWGLVTAAALVCIIGPLAVHQKPADVIAVNNAPKQQLQASVSDEQLLSDVQEDVSSRLPSPMLPLAVSNGTTGPATPTSETRENE